MNFNWAFDVQNRSALPNRKRLPPQKARWQKPSERFQFSRSIATVTAFLHLESHFLIVGKPGQAGLFDSGDMNKDVIAPIIRGNKPVTLCCIELFYGTSRHFSLPSNLPGRASAWS